MQFVRSIVSAFRNYVNFTGRANRRDFWFWIAFVVLVWLALLYVDIAYVAPMRGFMPMEEGAGTPVSNAWLIFCLLPTIAVIVRRVHDHDKPGWMALTIVPLAWWLIAKGTRGPNRYG